MGNLLAYSLAAGLVLTMMWLMARLSLGGHTFHDLMRAVLLISLGVSLAAPLFPALIASAVTAEPAAPAHADTTTVFIPIITDFAPIPTPVIPAAPLWLQILIIIYGTGVVMFAGRFLLSAISTVRIIRRARSDGRYGRWRVLRHSDSRLDSCSWGSYILLPEENGADDSTAVLIHESAHLSHRHWIDLIASELATIILWYWPTVWLLRRDLVEIHEYQADAEVIRSGADARSYQIMLLKKAAGPRFHSIACSLNNHSNISKRIKMMLRKKSRPTVRLRAVLAVPAVALGVGVLCTPVMTSALGSVSEAKVTNFFASAQQAPASENSLSTAPEATANDSVVVFIDDVRVTASQLDTIPKERIESIAVVKSPIAARQWLTDEEIAAGKYPIVICTKGSGVATGKKTVTETTQPTPKAPSAQENEVTSQPTRTDTIPVVHVPSVTNANDRLNFIGEDENDKNLLIFATNDRQIKVPKSKLPQIDKDEDFNMIINCWIIKDGALVSISALSQEEINNCEIQAIGINDNISKFRKLMDVITEEAATKFNYIFFIDGKRVSYSDFRALDPSMIKEMRYPMPEERNNYLTAEEIAAGLGLGLEYCPLIITTKR